MKKNYAFVFFLCSINLLINSSQLFAQDQWHDEISSDGSAPTARHENAFIECGGKLYLIGGRFDRPVNIYNPDSKTWTQAPKPPVPLHHFQAVSLNNLIYVVGAFSGNFPDEIPVDNVYIFNPSTNTWSTGDVIPSARKRGSAGVVVYNNKIYVAGGIVNGHQGGFVNWFDEYDPATGNWNILPDAPRARDHFHAALINTKIILTAGRTTSYATGELNNLTVGEVDVYDFSTGNWTTLANNIPTERGGASSIAVGNEVFVIGGERVDQTDALNKVEAVNIGTGNWRTLPSLNVGRHGTQAIFYDGNIYIAAGSKQKGGNGTTELSSLESYGFQITGSRTSSVLNLQVFPNPFENNIIINGPSNETINISVFNAIADLMKVSSGKGEVKMDLEDLPQGIYYVKISTKNEQMETFKIIKQ